MKIFVNQQKTVLDNQKNWTIAEVLAELKLNANNLALALNQTIVTKADWSTTQLKSDDRVDLFTMVSGG